MTLNVKIATVCSSIAALNISGVIVKDLDEVPENAILMPGVLYPNTERPIDNILPTPQSQGTGQNKAIDLSYDLHYRYLHCAPGNLGTNYYTNFISAITAIMTAFIVNDTVPGAVNLELTSVSAPGTVTDPAGNSFKGCDFTVRILEFCEVAP